MINLLIQWATAHKYLAAWIAIMGWIIVLVQLLRLVYETGGYWLSDMALADFLLGTCIGIIYLFEEC